MTIVTYALGSCLGITFYDRVRKIGVLLHIMLPNSKDHEKNHTKRAMFLDTGMEDIIGALAKEGADTRSLEVKVFGGAKVTQADNFFNIGTKNIAAFELLCQQMRFRVLAKEVGGALNRTIRLSLATGEVSLKMPAQPERIL